MERRSEVDMAKFFAIPFMICIHFYEQFGGYDFVNIIPNSLFRNTMEFLGGPLAAPVFMFSMGIGMIYTRRNSALDFIKRGIHLLTIGYLLNFFRQTLPQLIGLALGIDSGIDIIGGLLCVDILPFAGIAFTTIGLMRKIKLSSKQISLVAFLMQAVGIWSSRFHMKPGVVQNLLGLFIPTGKWTSFPLTLWMVYPALGMVFGEILKKCADKRKMYIKLVIFLIILLTALTSGLLYIGYDLRYIYALYQDSYYHNNILNTVWTLFVVIVVLGICYFLCEKIKNTGAEKFLRYCSVNLNKIYIIQWLIIAYSVAVSILLGYEKTYSPIVIILGGLTVTAISILISLLFAKKRREISVQGS